MAHPFVIVHIVREIHRRLSVPEGLGSRILELGLAVWEPLGAAASRRIVRSKVGVYDCIELPSYYILRYPVCNIKDVWEEVSPRGLSSVTCHTKYGSADPSS
jgi:hypothetical protein